MKKNGKLITLALFTFLMGSVPAFAREMTLEELGKEASGIQKDAGYVYIIGEYAFTSKFNIKTEDIMLASSTIIPENPTDPSKMVINQITRTYNDSYEATGWAKGTNALGTAELPAKVNVRYIDYNYIKDITKVDTDKLVKEEMKVNSGLFTLGELSNGEMKVTVNDLKQPVVQGMNSDVLSSLLELVKDGRVDHIDFEYSSDVKFTFTKATTIGDATTWFTQNCKKIFNKEVGEVITADLIDKSFTANLYLSETEEEKYISNAGNINAIYTITFDGTKDSIDVDGLMNESMAKVNKDLYVPQTVSGGKLVVDIVDLKAQIQEGMKSNILATLIDLVQKGDVESVDFSYGDLSFTYNKNTTVGDITAWLAQNSPKIFNKQYTEIVNADLLDKSFTAKVNLKSYAEANKGQTGEYVVSFTGTLEDVETNTLVSNAMKDLNAEIYKAVVDGNKVNVTIQDVDQEVFAGMGSNVLVELGKVLAEEDVKEVVFTYGSGDNAITYTYGKETTIGEAVTWFMQNCHKIFGVNYDDLTNADLVGESFTAQVVLEPWAKPEENNYTEFTVSFEAVKHTITFDVNGAKEDSAVSIEVADGQKITMDQLPKLHKENDQVLIGWTINGEDTDLNIEEYIVKDDITLKAKWKSGLSEEALEELSETAMGKIKVYNVSFDPKDDHHIIATFGKDVADQIIMVYLINNSHLSATGTGTGLNDAMTTFAANDKIAKVTIKGENGKGIDISVEQMKTLAENATGTTELAEKILTALGFTPIDDMPLASTVVHKDFIGKSVKFEIVLKEGEAFPEGFKPEYTLTFEQATV